MTRRSLWAEMEAEAETNHARAMQPSGPTDEHLMRLRKQIEQLKERGSRGEDVQEQLCELRRAHFNGNGAPGG